MQTEGIKYAGSKLRLLPFITEAAGSLSGVHTVLDGFSGSTRVSQSFAQSGYSTFSNDISYWSEVFATCYLLPSRPDKYYQEIIKHLNALPGYDGWFTEHYGGSESDIKKPFQKKNTRRLDAIRDEIDALQLPWNEKCVLLTSLILALDKVDNTLGHYAAYLSKWSARSYNDLKLQLPSRFELKNQHFVARGDIFSTLKDKSFDLAYFDPPYGSNNDKMPPSRVRYASYYHLWTTVVKNDKPRLFGKVNRREDSRDDVAASVFEDYKKDKNGQFFALEALSRLLKNTNARCILLSYSSGGRAAKHQLIDIISEIGTLIEIKAIDYRKNVMGSMRSTNKWLKEEDYKHYEYLFLIRK